MSTTRVSPKIAVFIGTLSLLFSLYICNAWTDESNSPLSQEQLRELIRDQLRGKLNQDRVLYLIADRGLDFNVDASFINSLKQLGATRLVLDAVKANGRARPRKTTASKASELSPSPTAAQPSQEASVNKSGAISPNPRKPEVKQLEPAEERSTNPVSTPQLSWNEFIEEVRESALQHTDDLPNFICTQVTRRYSDSGGSNRWQAQDILEAELTYNQKKESYANVLVNGRQSNRPYEALGGALSIGEFGSIVRALFMPQSQAKFRKEGEEVLRGLKTVAISFAVPQSASSWTLSFENSHSLKVAYRGNVWVDPKSKQVMKISQQTTQLPSSFPISYAETTTEYGYGSIRGIEGKQFLLPLRAELIMRESRQNTSTRNVIEFRDFRKFTTDVKLISDVKN